MLGEIFTKSPEIIEMRFKSIKEFIEKNDHMRLIIEESLIFGEKAWLIRLYNLTISSHDPVFEYYILNKEMDNSVVSPRIMILTKINEWWEQEEKTGGFKIADYGFRFVDC